MNVYVHEQEIEAKNVLFKGECKNKRKREKGGEENYEEEYRREESAVNEMSLVPLCSYVCMRFILIFF